MPTLAAPPLTDQAARYLDTLRASQLLSESQLAEVAERLSGQPAAALGDWLVSNEWITRWQSDHLLNGETTFFLGDYLLLQHLATGGMGTVYKCRHWHTGAIGALKLLAPELTNDDIAVQRFQREINL